MTTTTVLTTTARRVPVWAVVVAAPVAALAVWAVADLVLDVPLVAGDPQVTVGPAAVAVVSVLAAVAGWGVRQLFFRTHRTGWLVTCGAVLLVSLLGPLGAATPAATVWLATMHVVVGAVVAAGLAPRRA